MIKLKINDRGIIKFNGKKNPRLRQGIPFFQEWKVFMLRHRYQPFFQAYGPA
jgi:hypothetical protein